MLESLGVGMMVVGVFSASYHVCPNRLNFQFGEKSRPPVRPAHPTRCDAPSHVLQIRRSCTC